MVLTTLLIFSVAACKPQEGQNSSDSSSTDINETIDKGFDDTDIVLCENGQSPYTIIVGENASVCESYAASELQVYLNKATSAELSIVSESDSLNISEKYISIGRTKKLANSGISVTEAEVTRDGYKIYRDGTNVYICGGKDTGTAFGVYEFLKHEIGFEAYANDEIYYETRSKLYVKDFKLVDIPDFTTRTMDGIMWEDKDTAFKYRFLLENETSARYGYAASKDWLPGPHHSIKMIMPEEVYNNPAKPETYHPEWYLANTIDSNDPVYLQCCYTDELFIQTFIENMIKEVEKNPEARIVNIAQQDGVTWCPCDNCKAEIARYKHSGYFLRFTNKVVSAVEKWRAENCPNRYLEYATFAYGATMAPPMDDNKQLLDESCKPHPLLNIRLAFSGSCWYHALDDAECSKNLVDIEHLQNWASICDNFYVWSYCAYYEQYLIPFSNFNSIQGTLQVYKQYGLDNHIFVEACTGNNVASFGYLRAWLYGKLTWDVNADYEALLDDFFAHYYKDVAPEMRSVFELYRTIDAIRDETSNHNAHSQTGDNEIIISPDRWPKNVVETAESYLNSALEKCKNIESSSTREKLEKRVREERINILYLKLINYVAYGYDNANYNEFVKYFIAEVEDIGVKYLRLDYDMYKFLDSLKSSIK